MKKILFVDGCPRPQSRTRELAQAVLMKMDGQVQRVELFADPPEPLDWERLQLRDRLVAAGELSHPMLRFARQFAEADQIVIAAPYWDLLFPAVVRSYLEAVTVSGLTFAYGEDGIPRSRCRATRLVYVTTAGGPIRQDLGFGYVSALAQAFFGIEAVTCVSAQGLDIRGADPEALLEQAKSQIVL